MAATSVQPGKSNVLNKLFFGLLIGALALLGVYLFAGDTILFYINSDVDVRHASRGVDEVLTIGYAFTPPTLEPTHFDPITRRHLVNTYEGLVLTNRDLKVEPGLAVSWGLIDPLTWEFRLRPNVTFHNGRVMTAQDVVFSLERAVGYDGSQLGDLLRTIKSVDLSGGDRIRIHTNVPDPLLLYKLALVYVFPYGYTDFELPVGTGPYRMISREGGLMLLERNDKYWGPAPAFATVELRDIQDRRERLAALDRGELKLLSGLPPSAACWMIDTQIHAEGCDALQNENISIKSIPSLEVSFLAFNVQHELFRSRSVRKAVSESFDPQVFIDIAFGFAKPANQFVSSGVFGFNPEIEDRTYDLQSAKDLMNRIMGSSFERVSVTFDYPAALQPIGEYVQLQMVELGVDVDLNPLSDSALQQKISRGQSDFYFLGWRSELGDSIDFLQAVAHSDGLFNGSNYTNPNVDRLIDESRENLEEEERLLQMQEAMNIIVTEDIIGVPLFESETIFAFQKDIFFEPRVDGYVFASEIK